MCVLCVYISAEDGMAFVKWRVSARTCQKGPQSSGSRGGYCLCKCVCVCVSVYVCVQSITGEQKMSIKRPHL